MNDNMVRGTMCDGDMTRDEWAAREVGFERPVTRRPGLRQRAICWQLVTTLTLAISTLLAVTVLTLGYARADTLTVAHSDGASFALAVFIGLMLVGMGGLTAIMARPSRD
jgi:hypothetical protein